MFGFFALAAIIGLVAAASSSTRTTPQTAAACGPGVVPAPGQYDVTAWTADLAEITDPTAYAQIVALMQTAGATKASAPADIANLQTLATTLDDKGYHNAAKRARMRAADVATYYCLPTS